MILKDIGLSFDDRNGRTRKANGQFDVETTNMGHLSKDCIVCEKSFLKGKRNMKWWVKAMYCSYRCKGKTMQGKPRISKMTADGIRGIRLKAIGRPSPLKGRIYKSWTNAELKHRIRQSFRYRQWRSDVFTRDNFTCQWCGDNWSGKLNADHIFPFYLLMQKYEITDYEQALECDPIWNINNGRTLCVSCHKKTKTYGNLSLRKALQLELL